MKKCPSCGTENSDDLVFCKQCGASLTEEEQPTVDLKKPEPEAKSEYVPPVASPAAAAYVPPVAAPVPQFSAPAPTVRKVSGKAITGMALGLSGLGCATLAIIYAIVGVASIYKYENIGFGTAALVFALIGLGLGIPGIILGVKGYNAGTAPANHGIAKCGKVTSLITIIICGISLTLAIITLAIHG